MYMYHGYILYKVEVVFPRSLLRCEHTFLPLRGTLCFSASSAIEGAKTMDVLNRGCSDDEEERIQGANKLLRVKSWLVSSAIMQESCQWNS